MLCNVVPLTVRQLGQLLGRDRSLLCSDDSASKNMRSFIIFFFLCKMLGYVAMSNVMMNRGSSGDNLGGADLSVT